jgi:hypothetical protein
MVPVHKCAYLVPHSQEPIFKEELDCLVDVGVLRVHLNGLLQHSSPKKDGQVQWVSDFRELNKCIKRKIYPCIMDILHHRNRYEFFTKIDISMQYYTFELDDDAKDLCIIITPFGKYRYNRLPMGILQSPDFM